MSRIKTEDQVWYFFGRKENKYKKGVRLIRKTKSGFWKKTGLTMDIMRKTGISREKIGQKRVLVFHSSKISKSNWVMHEYHSTCSSPNQLMMTYTICKVQFKGESRDISSPYEIEHSHGGLTSGSEESSIEDLPELWNPNMLSGFLDEQQKTQLYDEIQIAFDNLISYDWMSLLDDDNDQSEIGSMHEDCSDNRNLPTPKSLTSVFVLNNNRKESYICNNRKESYICYNRKENTNKKQRPF